MLTLYDFPRAPSPRRALMVLIEKGAPFERVTIDLMSGEHLGDAYRAIVPTCTVPALKLEDGTVLSENDGIAAYLEAAFPEPPLMGVTPAEKGEVAMWKARVEYEGLMAVADALRNANPAMKDRALTGPKNFGQIPELAERGAARLKLFFETLEARLEGRAFVATDRFTVADIVAVTTIDFAKVVGERLSEAHPNLNRYRKAMGERASVQAE